jgi:hypothetical protein
VFAASADAAANKANAEAASNATIRKCPAMNPPCQPHARLQQS